MNPESAPPPRGVVWGGALRAGSGRPVWSLTALAGRFVEITGAAPLTAAAGLILEAQERGTPAAWIGAAASSFYPPDFAAWGIDLAALPVVHVEDACQGARAADTLLRSGGFALVMLDLPAAADLPLAAQSRLAGLAKQRHAVLARLRSGGQDRAPAGSLVSLRVETAVDRRGFDAFLCALRAVKDKRQAPGWRHEEVRHGPGGLC